MKSLTTTLGATLLVAAGSLALAHGASAAKGGVHTHRTMMTLELTNPTGPVTVKPNGKITVDIKTTGFTFAPSSVGKAAVMGQGHAHFYIDRMPVSGYSSGAAAANPANGWAGAFVSPVTTFDLKKSTVKVTRGQHLLIVALANNNHTLYRVPAAVIPFTVR